VGQLLDRPDTEDLQDKDAFGDPLRKSNSLDMKKFEAQ